MPQQLKKPRSKQTSKMLLALIALLPLIACGPSQAELKKRERRDLILQKANSFFYVDESKVTLATGTAIAPGHPRALKRPYPTQAELENALGKPDYREVIVDKPREITRLYWWEENKTTYTFTGQDHRDRRDGLRMILTADFGNKSVNDGYITEPGGLYEISIFDRSTTENIRRDVESWHWSMDTTKKP